METSGKFSDYNSFSAYYSEARKQIIECDGRAVEAPSLVAVVAESLSATVEGREIVPGIIGRELLDVIKNIDKLSFIGGGNSGELEFIKLTYYGPAGEYMLGAPTGLDIVVEKCTWRLLDLYYWEDSE